MRKLIRPLLIRFNVHQLAQKYYLSYLMLRKRLLVRIILPLFSWSGFLSSVYYVFFSRAYYREHKANLQGIRLFHKMQIHTREGLFYLIHNIHALEKGLTMRPRKDEFGIQYIRQTVKAYQDALLNLENKTIENRQIIWFHDVLEAYFNIVGLHEIIDEARRLFLSLPKPHKEFAEQSIPHRRGVITGLKTNYEDLLQLAQIRRSVRWFKQVPVEREKIDKAIQLAALSPSACNRQPFEFRVIDTPENLQRLAELPSGAAGFGHNFPGMVVIVGNLGAYVHERDRHVIYIDGGLAAMSFMFALETLHISSCPLNWPDIPEREEEMRKLLHLKVYERPIIVIAYGYADPEGLIAHSEKKPLDRLRYFS
jgi:nitroreductase